MIVVNLYPKLRFPNFQDELRKSYLEKEATFFKGKSISKSDIIEDGVTECIRYGELYTNYGEIISNVVSKTNLPKEQLVFSKANDVIIPSSGETALDIAKASCVMKDNIALGGDLNIIRTKNNGIFLSYYLNSKKKKDIAALAQGNSVVHLYNHQLKTLTLNLPSLNEQKKIATFLSAIDKKLAQLQQKKTLLEEYKKGVMQQLFSPFGGDAEGRGGLRFKQEDGSDYPDWEEKRLEKIVDYEQPTKYLVSSTEYDDSFKTPVLTAGKTFILGYTDETNNIFTESLPVILFDDFTTATQFVNFPFKAKSSAMKILIPKKEENIKFIYESIQNIRFEIGGHGRHWISKYSKFKIPYPCKEEQAKIANFLNAIDKKIELVSTQIENTQQFKKGLLQLMFV